MEGDALLGHVIIEDKASAAGRQVFPDPDGTAGPEGGRDGTGNNHRDAFRHAYWNALMTRAFGESSAEGAGTGHERRPDDPSADPMFEARAEAMDLYHNQIGRQAVREGKLVVFNDGYAKLVPSGGIEDFPQPR